MAETRRRVFLKKAVKVGNSAGVLLPKSFLGSDVKVLVLNKPENVKRDVIKILEPILEELLGVYFIKKTDDKTEILAVSIKINKHIEKGNYFIDVVPFQVLKKSITTKKETREKVKQAKTIINKKLLDELKVEL